MSPFFNRTKNQKSPRHLEIKEEQNVSLAPLAKVTIIHILHRIMTHKHLAGEGGSGGGGDMMQDWVVLALLLQLQLP